MKNNRLYHFFLRPFMLITLLCMIMIIVLLASCGGKNDPVSEEPEEKVSESTEIIIPVEVSISDKELEVGICTVHQITAEGGNQISWHSSDDTVAIIDTEGMVTGVSVGECDITAENEFGKNASCHVSVKKSVFLTIDDGPLGACSGILSVLKKNDVKATFFVVDTYNIKILKQMHDEGHYVALHTYSHNFGTCYRSEYSYYADLEKMKDVVKQYTGETPDIIRFPGGTGNHVMDRMGMRRMVTGAEDLGYRIFDWTCSSGDSSKPPITSEASARNVLRNCYQDVNIVLMHDKIITPKALKIIIPALRNRNYVFDTLDHYADRSFRVQTWYERSVSDQVVPCTDITLTADTLTLFPEESTQLKAFMGPDNTTDYLRFVSENPSIATVTLDGIITGASIGSTNIRAIASSGREAVCTVTVNLPSESAESVESH